MKSKTMTIITAIVILIPLAAGLLWWDRLPDDVAVHFSAGGIPDKWVHKGWAVFGLPLFILAAHVFCVFMSMNDPKKQNIGEKIYNIVLWICPACSMLGGLIIYTYSLGLPFPVYSAAQMAIGIVIIIIGNFLPKSHLNYTVGIKLPWTMSDSENWNNTHRFAGKVWIIGGLLLATTAFFNLAAVSLALMVLIVLLPLVYSFVYHKTHSSN